MVRTLDFQSKNVGSIPSNPIVVLNFKFLINNSFNHPNARFSFFFVSLISPNFIKNSINFFNCNQNIKKIQLKQSYVLFTWFYYLSITEEKKKKTLKFFVLPIKKRISTHIKAPIAHKNWSKEQFVFQYYLLRITFKSNFSSNSCPDSVNSGLLFVLLSKKFFPVFETNILFLKNYQIIFLLKESLYFNYFKILNVS